MPRVLALACLLLAILAPRATMSELTVVTEDPGGSGAGAGAPVRVSIDRRRLPAADAGLQLIEVRESAERARTPIAVQVEEDSGEDGTATLWWLMPPGEGGRRRFRLAPAGEAAPRRMGVRVDGIRKVVDVSEGDLPVLRYNHGTVPPPPEIVEHFERGLEHPLYYARGDYIHPLFGPDGEQLTDDYSLNHPHHRGVSWSWPVVRWKGEARDLWAVRVLAEQPGGIWARPVAMRRAGAGPVFAVVDAENVWKWGDEEAIVREEVLIRAFRSTNRCRCVDVEIRLTALADEVSIGGRPKAGYGGFAMRTFPEFENRHVAMHVDGPGSEPRRAWFHLTGNFPKGKGPAGVAMFEHVGNPGYPSYPNPEGVEGIPDEYPPWRSVLPCFPGDREVPLPKNEPLVLRHRLWIHPGRVDEGTLADVWKTYADPPNVTIARQGR